MEPAPASASRTDEETDWRATVTSLGADPEHLDTEELDLLARAHWWLGDIPEATRVGELAFERLQAEGRSAEAADRALRICLLWGTRGDLTLAAAWLSRAQRLLRDLPRSVVHGYALYLEAAAELDMDGDPSSAAAAAAQVQDLGDELGDRTLQCFALALAGMSAVRSGDLEGFTALNEAMIHVISGQVDPMWAGDIYCSIIHLCEALGDLGRMRSWTDALATWAAPLSSTFLYAGVTRVHQLQLLRAEGDWDLVQGELGPRSAGLAQGHGWLAGAGYYELGEVQRLRGEPAAARASYQRARSFGIEPQPGEALLLHAEGRAPEALSALRIALAGQGPLARARLIPATVEVALSAGETAFAGVLATELETTAARFATPGLVASAAQARAGLLIATGEYGAAARLLEEAARIYREQRHRHATARVHELLATVHRHLKETDRADAAEATARAMYQRLGASADLARMAAGSRPGGLTAREVEVLVHVSTGLSNKEVAQALLISDKTVSRHLASIFTKAQVATRTAAAAWAREHGLV